MPLSALPEHLQDVNSNFPDDDQFSHIPVFGKIYRWYQKSTKTWFAFSYRCTEWWARGWRKYPKVLFAVGGQGVWRIEHGNGDSIGYTLDILRYVKDAYLSRIQYYKRWHFAIQWPLIITFHVYFKAKDVPVYGQPKEDLDGKLFFFYWNHFDADLIYWMLTSFFIGFVWK
jgi:hypothetical protein